METLLDVYREQLKILREHYYGVFREDKNSHKFNTRLSSKLKGMPIKIDGCHLSLITVIPDIYIREDMLAIKMKEYGRAVHPSLLRKIREEKKRFKTPYIITNITNGTSALEHPEHTLNLLEKIFYFMYTGKFPSEDMTFQDIITP
ncbi:MAG: hypothetical protein COU47_03450 [Candidatus Niyogibacteria bacterium CG10_big_fil_rev_8_21_14_0_10_46_36]|uniref:Uncharacterized protein n=1 Tax=Candidatus Niyogibacteria bacterium CG10_big_fil_rev_8_21_14_0_10_46_36 TaxID=1974726 RepID=A0A2H0TCV9_9BACT|nr:MAG: hypothetical protein COU47_03450 [Candidatus Niyogibacteria bacterium CG10_big_fil_rev_8_21_14_0_10_46_36]